MVLPGHLFHGLPHSLLDGGPYLNDGYDGSTHEWALSPAGAVRHCGLFGVLRKDDVQNRIGITGPAATKEAVR